MTMRLVAVILAAALVGPAFAAGAATAPQGTPDPRISDGTLRHQLDVARKRWKAANLRNYRYEISVSCFCVPSKGVRYVVRNRVPRIPAHGDTSVATVPRLFKRIQAAIHDRVAKLDVSYGQRGVPKSIYIDSSATIADEEVGYTLTHFTRLK
jgi:hypothetical protein